MQRRSGGRPFSPQDIIVEMNRVGTAYPEGTIRAEVTSRMCVNAPDNHGTTWPDLRRVGRGLYLLNQPSTPWHQTQQARPQRGPRTPDREASHVEREAWPWEGAVQALFTRYLQQRGWTVTGAVDTATRARGVDVLAENGSRRLGAEVKGWPSTSYADPRRASEEKRTHPSTQAGHWFAQALMKGIMLLDSHPGYESIVVLPDFVRYRDLAARTRSGRAAADVHALFVDADGRTNSDLWTP